MYAISIIFSISHVTLLVLSQYSLQNHKHSYSCVAKNLNLIFFLNITPCHPPKKEKKYSNCLAGTKQYIHRKFHYFHIKVAINLLGFFHMIKFPFLVHEVLQENLYNGYNSSSDTSLTRGSPQYIAHLEWAHFKRNSPKLLGEK